MWGYVHSLKRDPPSGTDTANSGDLGLNHKNGGRECSELCKDELGPVAGETGPVWGGGDSNQCVLRVYLLWWVLFNSVFLAFC